MAAAGLGATVLVPGIAAGQTAQSALLDQRVLENLPTGRGFSDIVATQPFAFSAPDLPECSDLAGTLDTARANAAIEGVRWSTDGDTGSIDQTVWAFPDTSSAGAFIRALRHDDLAGCSKASAESVEPVDVERVVVIGTVRHFGEKPRLSAEATPVLGAATELDLGGPVATDLVSFWSAEGSFVSRVALRTTTDDVVDRRGRIQPEARPALAALINATHVQLWTADATALLAATAITPDDLGAIAGETGRGFFVDRAPDLSRATVTDLSQCRRFPTIQLDAELALAAPVNALEARVRTDVVVRNAWSFRDVKDARRFERGIARTAFSSCMDKPNDLYRSLDALQPSTGLFAAVEQKTADTDEVAMWYRTGALVAQVQVRVDTTGASHAVDWVQVAEDLGLIQPE